MMEMSTRKAIASRFEGLAAQVQTEALEEAKRHLLAQMNTGEIESKVMTALEKLGQIERVLIEKRGYLTTANENLALAEANLKMDEGYLACKNEDARKAWLIVNGPKSSDYQSAKWDIDNFTRDIDRVRLDLNAAEREYQTYRDLLKLRTAQLEFLGR